MDLRYLDKIKWYRQGGAGSLFYIFSPYQSVSETIGYDRNVVFQFKEMNVAFFDRDREMKKFENVIKTQAKDKKFIDRWIKDWEIKNKATLDYCELNFREPIEKWSDKKLVNFLSRFNQLAIKFWKKGLLLEWSDPDGLTVLNNFLQSYGINLSQDELNLLISPEKLTFVQNEFLKRIKIAEKKKIGQDVVLDIRSHTQQFHWYQNSWSSVHEFKEKYFFNLITEDIKYLLERKKEVEQIRKYLKEIKKEKRKIYKKYKIPKEAANILYMFTQMVDWRDYRKKISVCLPNHYLFQILKRLAVENHLTRPQVSYIAYRELLGWKIDKRMKKIIKLRETGALYACSTNKNCQWFYGDKAKKIYDKLIDSIKTSSLRGISASGGVVRGQAKIIETREDFKKMRQGDIIVATMTRPEYVPIMKMAGGIVTNEGGITCHATIISRELGIPCVIGTQTATDVLKDGDEVEVDADRGVITIIKRK